MEYIIVILLLAPAIAVANNYCKRKALQDFDRKYRASRSK